MKIEEVKRELEKAIINVEDFPKKGILFRDLTPILANPTLFKRLNKAGYKLVQDLNFDVVLSAESRGFWFGIPIAEIAKSKFIPARKPGKLPRKTIKETYDLEYGSNTIEVHEGDIPPNSRVLIVDDLIATSGTIEALCKIVKKANATLVGCYCVIGLKNFNGKEKITEKFNVPCITLFDF